MGRRGGGSEARLNGRARGKVFERSSGMSGVGDKKGTIEVSRLHHGFSRGGSMISAGSGYELESRPERVDKTTE